MFEDHSFDMFTPRLNSFHGARNFLLCSCQEIKSTTHVFPHRVPLSGVCHLIRILMRSEWSRKCFDTCSNSLLVSSYQRQRLQVSFVQPLSWSPEGCSAIYWEAWARLPAYQKRGGSICSVVTAANTRPLWNYPVFTRAPSWSSNSHPLVAFMLVRQMQWIVPFLRCDAEIEAFVIRSHEVSSVTHP